MNISRKKNADAIVRETRAREHVTARKKAAATETKIAEIRLKTAVVILNWNTRAYLETFIPPLLKSLEGRDDVGVVVADNNSGDGSAEALERLFPQVRLIKLEDNFGFTGGYNRAIDILLKDSPQTEYFVLLNSDVYVEKGWIEPLLSHMDSHPECAVCGPKFLSLKKDGNGSYRKTTEFEYAGAAGGYLDRYGFPFCRGRVLSKTEEDKGQYDSSTPCNVLWISGACLMTRASFWRELGGLDERYFAHCEEIDYCWRARLAGYSVCAITESKVFHLGGGTLPQGSPFKLRLNYRNSLLMLEGNLSRTFGEKKARTILRRRLFIDNCAAVFYLVCGKTESFKAVRLAHKEFRAMKGQTLHNVIPDRKTGVCGIVNTCIIPQSVLRGKRIFEYLRRKYENSN